MLSLPTSTTMPHRSHRPRRPSSCRPPEPADSCHASPYSFPGSRPGDPLTPHTAAQLAVTFANTLIPESKSQKVQPAAPLLNLSPKQLTRDPLQLSPMHQHPEHKAASYQQHHPPCDPAKMPLDPGNLLHRCKN